MEKHLRVRDEEGRYQQSYPCDKNGEEWAIDAANRIGGRVWKEEVGKLPELAFECSRG